MIGRKAGYIEISYHENSILIKRYHDQCRPNCNSQCGQSSRCMCDEDDISTSHNPCHIMRAFAAHAGHFVLRKHSLTNVHGYTCIEAYIYEVRWRLELSKFLLELFADYWYSVPKCTCKDA